MAYKLMIQGTMSSAGKSFIVTALCRIFSDLGYRVAPFKSQNMALNSGVTFDGLEMGRAQIVQAEAARTVPDVRMNPILLKPNSDIGSQVIVMGKSIGNMKAREYYDYKTRLIPIIKEAFNSLEKEYDVIIVEGAGSPAEINLKENDIVNMGLAKLLDIPVLLVGDIDLGGVFAQLLGTIEWLEEDEKEIIKGFIINKFRGDATLLKPGIDMLRDRTNKDVYGVIPYSKINIDEEDSVTVDLLKKKENQQEEYIKIYVIRLPHLSNFTDFTPLSNVNGVSLKYIDSALDSIPDMIIIPGTKNTIADMKWMNENGLSEYIKSMAKMVPIVGICGGYQMLGKSIEDPNSLEGNESFIDGLALLEHSTVINIDKTLKKTKGVIKAANGFFECLAGCEYEGYEIHCGISIDNVENENSTNELIISTKDNILGTYIHGFFDKAGILKAMLKQLSITKSQKIVSSNYENNKYLCDKFVKALEAVTDYSDEKDKQYDLAAKVVREALDLKALYKIMGI